MFDFGAHEDRFKDMFKLSGSCSRCGVQMGVSFAPVGSEYGLLCRSCWCIEMEGLMIEFAKKRSQRWWKFWK
jgi:hypothetical protein